MMMMMMIYAFLCNEILVSAKLDIEVANYK